MILRVCESLGIDAAGSGESGTLQTGNALDLYSGCGVFAHFLQKKYAGVYLIEENAASLLCARDNVPYAHMSAMSGKHWTQQNAARLTYEVVVADPPRSGLEKEILAWLCDSHPRELRYVSCDPVTLARDSMRLTSAGYRITALELYDFYPQTSHIEMLACFTHYSK
jgi:23S rRNA (uracil1939-C5)-methyltransferase